MTEKINRAVSLGSVMAAASVLGLSLGMTADAASTGTQGGGTQAGTSEQHKGESTQLKYQNQDKWNTSLKHNTGTNQIKWNSSLKHNTGSNQIKWNSVQHKHETPSSELNPQPEPPKPLGISGQHKHDTPSSQLNPQPEPPMNQTGAGGPTPK
jgi:hypothetical protein